MSRKLASRSTHGCWTCRLRKKKCDEDHPSCLRCTSLHINCDGYGPRPYWMDRGDLQRTQARFIARIIAQARATMREKGAPSTWQTMNHSLTTLVTNTMEPSPTYLTHEAFLQRGNFQLCGTNPASAEHLWSTELTRLLYDQSVGTNPSDQSSSFTHTLTTSISPIHEENSLRDAVEDVSNSNIPTSSETNVSTMELLYDPVLSLSEFSGYSSEADWSLPTQRTSRSSSIGLTSPSTGLRSPIVHGDVEDILLMHYFDQVFYIHCPFYSPSNREGRGWLFSVLKRGKSAYHAALALSEFHHSIPTQTGLATAKGEYYQLAIQELQTNLTQSFKRSGTPRLSSSVESLTTILHLLFYEV